VATAAHARVHEQLGKRADAQGTGGLEGEGVLGPGEGIGKGGKEAEDGVGETGGAEGAAGGDPLGDVGALARGMVGDAGLLRELGHLDAPALLEGVEEVAHAEGVLLVLDAEVAEGGEVGLPLGAVFRGEIGSAGRAVIRAVRRA
jgi:hypothetical protein